MKNIHLRMKLEQVNSVGATNTSSTFRVSVIAHKQKITTSLTTPTITDIYRGATTDLANRGMLDLSKCDVLFDQTYNIPQPNQSNVSQHFNMVANVKLNKSATYESDNAAYFKDKTIYLVFTATKTDPSLAVVTHGLNYQWTANFKDA